MINIVHKRGTGAAEGPINYLLGKDRKREGARVLRGDVEMTRQIINAIPFKKKYTSGVLSFEESNISEDAKNDIMTSFQKFLMAGLDNEQYQILWVEHTDKNRLELNYLIANQELRTGKSLTPYFHKRDKNTVNAWRILVNEKYSLSDPDQPTRAQLFIQSKDLPRAKSEAQKHINQAIERLVLSGVVHNRSEIIKALENGGFEVSRITKNSISIADPQGGRNIRLSGTIYEQDFRLSEDIQRQLEKASGKYRSSRSERIHNAQQALKAGIERKRKYYRERYAQVHANSAQRGSEKQRDSDQQQQNEMAVPVFPYINHNGSDSSDNSPDYSKSANGRNNSSQIHKAKKWQESHQMQQQRKKQSRGNALHTNRGLIYDGIRANIIEAITATARAIKNAMRSFIESATRVAHDVREYETTERSIEIDVAKFHSAANAAIKKAHQTQLNTPQWPTFKI